MSPLRGAVCWVAFFIGPIVGLYYTVKAFMPDKPSYPKEYEGGLEAEMGGPGAVRVRGSFHRNRFGWVANEE